MLKIIYIIAEISFINYKNIRVFTDLSRFLKIIIPNILIIKKKMDFIHKILYLKMKEKKRKRKKLISYYTIWAYPMGPPSFFV